MNKIEDLIVNGKIDEAIDLIYEAEDRTDFVNKIIILKSDLTLFKKKSNAGLFSHDEETRALNKIRYRLLEIIALVKQEKSNLDSSLKPNSASSKFNIIDEKFISLTKDQFKVLNFIDKIDKVRVSGNAGSGKTLVAVEKAIRLSKAGVKVLILCHNPVLANRIKDLVSGYNVLVSPFGKFVKNILEDKPIHFSDWNNFHEPTQEELSKAIDYIHEKQISYRAVIIDEGQDFRDIWWMIVDAIQANVNQPITYIFHDDNQALLPNRSKYPFEGPIVNLSKNVRNAGNIHEFIRHNFHSDAPETSEEVAGLGYVKVFPYQSNFFFDKTLEALDWIKSTSTPAQPVILLAGDLNRSKWEFGEVSRYIPIGAGWKQALIHQFTQILPNVQIDDLLTIKGKPLPNEQDIQLVSTLASKEYEKINMKRILSLLGPSVAKLDVVKWVSNNRKVSLNINHENISVKRYFLLKFLSTENWANGLRKIVSYEFLDHKIDHSEQDKIAVFETASFKGLEANEIIIVTNGQSFLHLNELYVASSRAKKTLAIVVDKKNERFYIPE